MLKDMTVLRSESYAIRNRPDRSRIVLIYPLPGRDRERATFFPKWIEALEGTSAPALLRCSYSCPTEILSPPCVDQIVTGVLGKTVDPFQDVRAPPSHRGRGAGDFVGADILPAASRFPITVNRR